MPDFKFLSFKYTVIELTTALKPWLASKLLIENSKVISEDIELKLRAGAASVIDLATEKMNFFDLRSQRAALEYQNINEVINFYQALGHQCDLTELCDQIDLVTISK